MALDKEVDLLVIGSGGAGLTAALMAAVDGYRVKVVEKTAYIGGTTAYSSGTAWIPNTRIAREGGARDGLEQATQYLDWVIESPQGQALRAAFLASGSDAVDFLHRHTGCHFVAPPQAPDYRVGPGAVEGGRALVAQELDGRLLEHDFARIRPPRPGFDLLGGMMVNRADILALMAPWSSWRAARHTVRILARHAMDRLRYPRGTRLVMGNALVGRLVLELRQRGVHIATGCEAMRLLTDGVRVTGAMLRDAGGQSYEQQARAVVLATGGWSAGRAWRERFLPAGEAGLTVAAPGNDGAGLHMAQQVGAAFSERDHRSGAFWMPTSVHRREGREPVLFPHIVMDRAKPGLIAVNQKGERFVNEAGSYHDFVSAMLDHPDMGAARPAWLLVDARFIWRYGLGLVKPWRLSLRRFVADGYLLRADRLQELAGRMGVDPEGLVRTVERHNTFAQRGEDPDFGRGSTPLNRQNGDARVQPNPCVTPIVRAPFYALPVWPADLATSAGLRTDEDARVLTQGGSAIQGLYAVGNDMASVMQGTYPGPGTTLGPAIVFAYRATRHLLRHQPPGGAL